MFLQMHPHNYSLWQQHKQLHETASQRLAPGSSQGFMELSLTDSRCSMAAHGKHSTETLK
jgi:hypothetical protein